jgi:hypothetical protein
LGRSRQNHQLQRLHHPQGDRAGQHLLYYYSSTSTAARGIHCQEVGHGFGLDHSNDGGCMGAGYWYSVTNAYRPVSHNVNDVGSMYANRDVARHTDHPTVGPEHGAPRFHANWFNTPRNIRQASRLATNVVVATVTAVTDGAPILDNEGGIPTQRVHFVVNRSPKGELVGGESFVLFQNGNDENRFDEDPDYKVGSRHLLFLTPREDGTYLVLSPEGRYELTAKGLEPASHQGFAADLKGAKLKDVLADVVRALED